MADAGAPHRYRRIQALAAARLAQQVLQVWRELMNPANVDASWKLVECGASAIFAVTASWATLLMPLTWLA